MGTLCFLLINLDGTERYYLRDSRELFYLFNEMHHILTMACRQSGMCIPWWNLNYFMHIVWLSRFRASLLEAYDIPLVTPNFPRESDNLLQRTVPLSSWKLCGKKGFLQGLGSIKALRGACRSSIGGLHSHEILGISPWGKELLFPPQVFNIMSFCREEALHTYQGWGCRSS